MPPLYWPMDKFVEAFSWLLIDEVTPSLTWWSRAVLVIWARQGWKHHSFMASALVSPSSFLSWIFVQTPCWRSAIYKKKINPFLSCVFITATEWKLRILCILLLLKKIHSDQFVLRLRTIPLKCLKLIISLICWPWVYLLCIVFSLIFHNVYEIFLEIDN